MYRPSFPASRLHSLPHASLTIGRRAFGPELNRTEHELAAYTTRARQPTERNFSEECWKVAHDFSRCLLLTAYDSLLAAGRRVGLAYVLHRKATSRS